MAYRLKLVPDQTNIDFFRWAPVTFGGSVALVIAAIIASFVIGLNFGIDFKGGTTIRTESTEAVDVGAYRQAIQPLTLSYVSITEVFDPTFRDNQHVAMIRIQAQEGAGSITPETIDAVEEALKAVDGSISFPSVELVGPKVSGELNKTAIWSVLAAADVLVGRAGSSTLAEAAAAGLPMIVVPYPHAAAHQRANAAEMVEAGAAVLVDDADLGGDTLRDACALLFDARLTSMSAAAKAVARPGAAAATASLLERLAAREPLTTQAEIDK